MRGLGGAERAVETFLRARHADYLDVVARAAGWSTIEVGHPAGGELGAPAGPTEVELVPVENVSASDPPPPDRPEATYPYLFVVGQRLVAQRVHGRAWDTGEPLWARTYAVRVFAWVAGQEYADTRDRLRLVVLAIEEAFRDRPSLDDPDAVVDPAPWSSSFSEVDSGDARARMIAAAWLEVPVTLEETMTTADVHDFPIPDGWDLGIDVSLLPRT